ncbi:serine/threonine-protein kinase PLK1 [Folsomia candida]|uniref:serine/threonine-protein kinase PLK1 n=1 Tax=Folsomia candida TaxID=158441 RepID=UPI000B8F6E4B|nr:serine/threonine-protein kinase PLK1 [Folsomia candida]
MSRQVRGGGGGGGDDGRADRENQPQRLQMKQLPQKGSAQPQPPRYPGSGPSTVVRAGGGGGQAAAAAGAAAAAAPPPPSNPTSQSTQEIPTVIRDVSTGNAYARGKLLGKGGFARCFEVQQSKTRQVVACKIVNKELLIKPHQRDKMIQEITIHRKLRHEFIVKFLSHFEDDSNVYITLELCSKKSLMELQKRRRILTEPEAKYFLRQIAVAVQYLHEDMHIIHRDLKLGNIFISEDMKLKIGDFGLATTVDFEGERKKTLCGTPNYIAPEVLGKKGHSYQVDIWSIGCILYTLLIGRPPFETATLRDTYQKIRRGEYIFPQNVKIGHPAKNLLHKMLQVNPDLRPSARQIISNEFILCGFMPTVLPLSVLTMAPRFDFPKTAQPSSTAPAAAGAAPPDTLAPTGQPKKPLTESNQPRTGSDGDAPLPPTQPSVPRTIIGQTNLIPRVGTPVENANNNIVSAGELDNMDMVEYMKNLRDQLKRIIELEPRTTLDDNEAEEPALSPFLWICKWVDYSDKYGFGYNLCDDTVGVSFNDNSKIILLSDARSMHYIEKEGVESYYSLDQYPNDLSKKVKLLKYFQQYMKDNLMKATGDHKPLPPNCIARVPNMWTWFRTSRSVVMVLSSGTIQINNFRDHTKMILCPMLGAITTLGPSKHMRTYKIASMDKGLSSAMLERLTYALEKVEVIIGNHMKNNSFINNVMESPAKLSVKKKQCH